MSQEKHLSAKLLKIDIFAINENTKENPINRTSFIDVIQSEYLQPSLFFLRAIEKILQKKNIYSI